MAQRVLKKFFYLFLIFSVILGSINIMSLSLINPFEKKYVISLYHFNSQFVPSINDFLGVEKNIINESIRGILDMYMRHPSWKFDIEISGICLKVMHDNYSDVFNKLKILVDRNQCELILSPYSEQLSIAFTYIDMIKSFKLSQELAKSYNITYSNVLFLQENQFHTAFPILKKLGYEIFCVSGDTFRYYDVNNIKPEMDYSYNNETVNLMVTTFPSEIFPVKIYGSIEIVFRWYGDGEASNTNSGMGNADPNEFKLEPERMTIHEERGNILEFLGFNFIKVSDWVSIAKSNSLTSVLTKIVPDSTWNTFASFGAYQWMGFNYKKADRNETENDGFIRADNYRTRNKILVAESLFTYYNNTFNTTFREQMKTNLKLAWEHLMLAEVSDATGWEPRKEEWEYSIFHDNQAVRIVNSTINAIKRVVNITTAQVFTLNNTVINNSANFVNLTKSSINLSALPINISVEGSNYTVQAFNNTFNNYSFYSILLNIKPSILHKIHFNVSNIKNITYSPSLLENQTQMLFRSNYSRKLFLPLTNGLIYVNGVGIIRNNSRHYASICWDINTNEIYQMEQYQEHNISVEFFVLKSDINTCLNLANIINTYPIKVI